VPRHEHCEAARSLLSKFFNDLAEILASSARMTVKKIKVMTEEKEPGNDRGKRAGNDRGKKSKLITEKSKQAQQKK